MKRGEMRNKENIINYNAKRSSQEARANGKKGGIASVKARQEKKQLKAIAKELLTAKITDDKEAIDLVKSTGINPTGATYSTAIVCALINRAIKGDVNAFKLVYELSGENEALELDKKNKKLDIKLKETNIRLKEQTIDKLTGIEAEKIIIVNDLEQAEKALKS